MTTASVLSRCAAAAVLAMAGSGVHANLLTNGSFEDNLIDPPGVWEHQNPPPGWTVSGSGSGPVIFSNSYLGGPVGAGSQAAQLEWHTQALSQQFATVLNQPYELSFMVSGYNAALAPLNVAVGPVFGNYVGANGTWTTHTLSFTGTGSPMTVTFTNTGGAAGTYGFYPHIDNVSVTAVPEPSAYALALAGLGVMGLLGRRRKAV